MLLQSWVNDLNTALKWYVSENIALKTGIRKIENKLGIQFRKTGKVYQIATTPKEKESINTKAEMKSETKNWFDQLSSKVC